MSVNLPRQALKCGQPHVEMLRAGGAVWHRLAAFLTRKRALVTTLAVLPLLAIEFSTGHKPLNLADLSNPRIAGALVCVAIGLSLRSWAAGTLHKSTVLTTTGPYRAIRNPLYAGSSLLMLGFCTLLGWSFSLLAVLGPIGWLYVMKIRKEEQTLSQRHGASWTDYARVTPRFFPRAWPRLDMTDWRWTLWARNHEYRAAIAVVAGLAALKLWHDL